MKTLILASSSPRRKILLKQVGLNFEVYASNIEEKLNPRLSPGGNAEQLSLQKAKNVAEKMQQNKRSDAVVLSADTFIVFNREIIGKPADKKDAKRILQYLSGKSHLVISGFTVLDLKTGKTITKSVETKVFFKKLSKKEIDDYIATGEPLDKAGAYGMQERAGIFVERLEGSPFNVVGLPLAEVADALRKCGISIL